MGGERAVWFVDRVGQSISEGVTLAKFELLLASLDGSDPEHGSISVTDEDGWNLEVYPHVISFENVEPGGSVVGSIRDAKCADLIDTVREFLTGDLEALRARPWA